jgi:hypothetical protein
MKQPLDLPLDGFAGQALWTTARRHGLSPAEFVADAAEYFLAEREQGRSARLVPDFARNDGPGAAHVAFELDLPDGTWHRLNEESVRQAVAVERLLAHAALYLIGDLNAGRVSAQSAYRRATA